MSRLTQAKPAVRPSLPARALLSGPPGSGKTRTALIVAEVLAEGGTVLVIDTEKESALTYADDFTFTHLPWQPPFNPRELAEVVAEAGNTYGVVIIDSLTHFWRGEGGTLDIAGGKFTGWKDARPAQIDLVEAVLGCRAHVLVCARSKVEHVQNTVNGRQVVEKLGMAVVQDDDLEYEMNVAVEIDMTHALTVSKSRTVAVPVGRTFTAGHADQFATLYRDWLKGGEPPAPPAVVDAIRARVDALPKGIKGECKAKFLAEIGRTDHLRESQIADAETLVSAFEQQASGSDSPRVADPDPAPGAGDEDASHSADGSGGTEPPPEPDAEPPPFRPPTKPMLAKLHAALGEKDIKADEERWAWASVRLQREITSLSQMSFDEVRAAIDDLERGVAA